MTHLGIAVDLDLQIATDAVDLPSREQFETWLGAAFDTLNETLDAEGQAQPAHPELTIRLVDIEESATLNAQYRQKQGPTNVLSFPFEQPPGLTTEALTDCAGLLGDLIICAPVVAREADEQAKTHEAHWAHMTIHGLLHLLGHDHTEPDEAARMEALEIHILAGLAFPTPYEVEQGPHDQRPI